MEEICKNTLVPQSLVLRRCECFYCGAEDTGVVVVEHLFGMKVCETHRLNAERDCKAFLHRENLVRVKDAMTVEPLKRFLDILAAQPFITVQRTNGEIEEDWSLRTGNYFDPAFLSRNLEMKWGVPTYCRRTNQQKTVPIINFLRPEINGKMNLSADWHAIVEDAIDALVDGVYRADAEAYDYARNHDESEKIVETEGVATVIYEGRIERVFMGGSVQSRPREDAVEKPEEVGDL
jgi:hypothetical protein